MIIGSEPRFAGSVHEVIPAEEAPMLVTRRKSLKATDLDGEPVVLSQIVAKKLYRCPGCGERIEVGNDHVLVPLPPPTLAPLLCRRHGAARAQRH
jgi:hypothetical protein